MKLIDILVRDLHKFGGWPDGAIECHRFVDEANIDFYDTDGQWWEDCFIKYGNFAQEAVRGRVTACESESVTKQQYEAALAASKAEWDGDGYPPVGCKFEYKESSGKWFPAIMKYCGERFAIVDMDGCESWLNLDAPMRKIRSEADKKRDKAIKALKFSFGAFDVNGLADMVYDAIAAGKIPHIRID